MTKTHFEASEYSSLPTLTLAATLTLARELLRYGTDLPAFVAKSRARLEAATEAADAAYGLRHREQGQVEDGRAVDYEADAAWGGLRDRLVAYARLPADRYPGAVRARELMGVLFPDGLAFLRGTFPEQSQHMATLLEQIEVDGLAQDIIDLAGAEFLDRVQVAQPAYEAMVSGVLARPDGSATDLAGHRYALSRAIVKYASKVVATVEDDEPETIEAAREALQPIASITGRASRSGTGADDSTEPGDGGGPGGPADPADPADPGDDTCDNGPIVL